MRVRAYLRHKTFLICKVLSFAGSHKLNHNIYH